MPDVGTADEKHDVLLEFLVDFAIEPRHVVRDAAVATFERPVM